MKKITILISGMLLLGITGCETTKAEQGGGLIDPMSSQKTTVDEDCAIDDERCETGGGLIDPNRQSVDDDCDESDGRCETGGGLIDPAQ